jgi:hypothetical protein
MWIVALGWCYVVVLMAATEPSVIAGIMTLFGYCVLPLSIVFYLAGAKRRRARRQSGSIPEAPVSNLQVNAVGLAPAPLADADHCVPPENIPDHPSESKPGAAGDANAAARSGSRSIG